MDKKLAIELYRTMLRIRRVEEKVSALYPGDKIQSPIHLSTGQEAVATGVCLAMASADHIYGTYRGHALYIARGADLKKLFAELYAKDTGCARGKGGSMHLASPENGLMGCSAIVASTIPVAVGDALASKMSKAKRVAVAFFGDGAVDEGVFFESVNFALLKNLPVLFLLENNGYAIHSKVADRHKQTQLWRLGEGLGLKGRRYDGNDVFSVYAETKKAIDGLRRGGAPRLLEFMTHRWGEHVGAGSDFNESYRLKGEEKRARSNDPLPKARRALETKWKISRDVFDRWETELQSEIDAAVDFAEKSPFPRAERLWEDVFL
ncbi:MAG TPA: thiamine pyrophosphate-dependent dehydrogenase E1 component subunit alpha [Elusimicrobiota bacterium]|nr:thiamine pyrophosphate-dependent dehydrogenase E1 component subunit alpha [Elusimicrobiota bacterium]